jgi:hypothetical protein
VLAPLDAGDRAALEAAALRLWRGTRGSDQATR